MLFSNLLHPYDVVHFTKSHFWKKMTKNTKIILFTIIGVLILALLTYGYISTQKLEQQKIDKVDSNIGDFIYDEASDTLGEVAEEDDLDGDEVTDEDDDFETYEEDGGWEDAAEETTKPSGNTSAKTKTEKEDDLEELYDPSEDKKQAQTKPAPKEETPPKASSETMQKDGSYLVIVGSFKSKRNARKKLAELEKAGFDGLITQLKNSTLQTVVAGQFKTETAANALARELKKEHDLSAIVRQE